MRYYYTYKITCLKGSLKGCFYLGKHSTKDLNDNYCGSGKIINDYYKKYGAIENVTYTKEILNFYSNATELSEAEYELINPIYQTNPQCLNLTHGGAGGFVNMTEERRKTISNTMKSKSHDYYLQRNSVHKGKKRSEETKRKQSEKAKGNKNAKGCKAWNKDVPCTEDRKQKIRDNAKNNQNYGMKNKKMPEESKAKMRAAKLGKHWRINPETNKREWY